MLLKFSKILFMLVAATAFTACSDDDAATPGTFATVQAALERAAPDVDSTAIFLPDPLAFMPRASVSAALTSDNTFSPPGGGGFTDSLLEYVEKMYNDDLDDAVFSRANMPFLIVCTLDALADKTGDIMNNGTQTFTLNVSQLSACGTAADYTGGSGSLDGSTVTAVISTPADTTYYDSYIIMDGTANPMFGGNDQFMYFRKTATTLNFAHYEMDDSGSPTNASATWLRWDITAGSGAFQYISRYASGDQFYRIAYDPTANDARIFTYSSGGGPMMTTSAASTATSQTQAAFSFTWSGQSGGSSATNANGCLDIGGVTALDTDDTLTCSGNSKTVAASASTAVVTYATGLSIGTIAGYGSTSATGDGLMPDFTGTDITTSTTGW